MPVMCRYQRLMMHACSKLFKLWLTETSSLKALEHLCYIYTLMFLCHLSSPAQHHWSRAGQAASRSAASLWRQQGRKDPEKRAGSVSGSQTESLVRKIKHWICICCIVGNSRMLFWRVWLRDYLKVNVHEELFDPGYDRKTSWYCVIKNKMKLCICYDLKWQCFLCMLSAKRRELDVNIKWLICDLFIRLLVG